MKYIIVLFSLFYLANFSLALTHEDAKKTFTAAIQKCSQKNPLTPAETKKIQALELQTTRNGLCLIACVMKHVQVMSSSNKTKKDGFPFAVALLYPQESSKQKLADRMYKSCAKISDPDECEAANKLGLCMYKVKKPTHP